MGCHTRAKLPPRHRLDDGHRLFVIDRLPGGGHPHRACQRLVKVDDASAWMAVVIGMLIAYDVGVALLGYWGVRLCLQIFKKSHNTTEEKKQ